MCNRGVSDETPGVDEALQELISELHLLLGESPDPAWIASVLTTGLVRILSFAPGYEEVSAGLLTHDAIGLVPLEGLDAMIVTAPNVHIAKLASLQGTHRYIVDAAMKIKPVLH